MGVSTELTTARILEVFTDEVGSHRGVVTEAFDDGKRLFVRSVLPQLDIVRSGDQVQGGVALRATEQGLWVHPYVFRQVCRNGAITAQTVATRQLDDLQFQQPEQILQSLREAVAWCCAAEIFSESVRQMRIATQSDADVGITLMPLLSRLEGHGATHTLAAIMEHFVGDGDRSRFGLLNAVTATARETRDPELRWNLEEFGGGMLVGGPPESSPRHPQTATVSRRRAMSTV